MSSAPAARIEPVPDQGVNLTGAYGKAFRIARLTLATLLHGVGTGVIGIFIALLIRSVQEIGYGNDESGFLEIAMQAPPWRRLAAVTCGGLFGALAWYWLRGREQIIITVEESLQGARMPPLVTLLNGMIQDIVVALGGSFGREAAPREIAAMWGGVLADTLRVPKEERKILVACGTGAGLAAVYSVPISGTLYTLEHVLNWDLSLGSVLPAAVTSCVATYVASVVVESEGLYAMPKYSYEWPSMPMLLWACMIGPLAGLAAIGFRRFVKLFEVYKPLPRNHQSFETVKEGDVVWLTHKTFEGTIWREVRQSAKVLTKTPSTVTIQYSREQVQTEMGEIEFDDLSPEGSRDWKILVYMPIAFVALGLLSIFFPSLLGNGRALAEVAIKRQRTVLLFVLLICFKTMMTASAIGSGAAGGTLTPSVALGATLGAIVGEFWQFACPTLAPKDDDAMSVVAAAAFLSIMLRSPVSSLWLMIEFAAQGISYGDLLAMLHGHPSRVLESKALIGMLLPMGIAIAGATLSTKAANKLWELMQPPKQAVPMEMLEKMPMVDAESPETTETVPKKRESLVAAKKMLIRRRRTTFDLDIGDKQDPMELVMSPDDPLKLREREMSEDRPLLDDMKEPAKEYRL